MPKLTDPIRLGAIAAPNRMLMAPLTRERATRDGVPTPLMAAYYRQRASAGLIITEATGISRAGLGWPNAPGLWSAEQVAGWREVTTAVHEGGGRIVAQLWHMGRVAQPDVTGSQPVSASATTAPGEGRVHGGMKRYAAARALGIDEIPALLDDYARAAGNALEAGFDGVQLHAANGYLIDQFLRDATNLRTDAYGGTIDNRVRLLGEVSARLVRAIGGERVGVRLSPNGAAQGVDDSDPHALFGAAAAALDAAGIAWLEVREFAPGRGDLAADAVPVHPVIRRAFPRPLVLNGDHSAADARALLDAGTADAVAFGRFFLANPDLPRRIVEDLPLNSPDPATFYAPGAHGYTDYPAWDEAARAA